MGMMNGMGMMGMGMGMMGAQPMMMGGMMNGMNCMMPGMMNGMMPMGMMPMGGMGMQGMQGMQGMHKGMAGFKGSKLPFPGMPDPTKSKALPYTTVSDLPKLSTPSNLLKPKSEANDAKLAGQIMVAPCPMIPIVPKLANDGNTSSDDSESPSLSQMASDIPAL